MLIDFIGQYSQRRDARGRDVEHRSASTLYTSRSVRGVRETISSLSLSLYLSLSLSL